MKESRALAVGLFVTAVVVSLAVTAATGRFSSPDRWEYSQIADNILAGRGAYYQYLGTHYFFYGSALYPRLMAAVMAPTGGSEGAVLVVQSLLFGGLCVVIFFMTRAVFDDRTALLAGALTAFHPGLLLYAGRLHSQILDALLITVAFWLLVRVDARTSAATAVAVGAMAGVAAATRGTVLAFCVLWTPWFFVREHQRMSRAVRIVGALAVGGLLALSPLLIKGYSLYGEIVPLRTDNGVNFWTGNHVGATGKSYTAGERPVPAVSTRPPELVDGIAGLNEVAQNRAFGAAARRFIRENPAEFVALFVKKLFYFWWFTPHTGLLYPSAWTGLYKLYYAFALALALAGLATVLTTGQPEARTFAVGFMLLAAAISTAQALFYVDGRHRWEIEPLLLVFTAAGACQFWRAAVESGRLRTAR